MLVFRPLLTTVLVSSVVAAPGDPAPQAAPATDPAPAQEAPAPVYEPGMPLDETQLEALQALQAAKIEEAMEALQVAEQAAFEQEILAIVEQTEAELAALAEEAHAEAAAAAEAALADAAADATDKDMPAVVATLEPALLEPPVVWASRGLLDFVPEDTATAFHKRSHEGSLLADSYAMEVVQAVCDAQFDELLFDTLDLAGAPPELVTELRGYRNLLDTFAGAVPWRDLLGHEFVWAESGSPAFGPDGMPAMLLLARTDAGRVDEVESRLAMLLGALTTASPLHARLDIQDLHHDDGSETTHYALRMPLDQEFTLVQMAVHGDTLALGLGDAYFGQAVDLLSGHDGPRLLATHRFQNAIADLPAECTATHYVDVRRQVDTVEDVVALVQGRAFNSGYWQTTLNDALRLYDHVETIATATRCDGEEVLMETVTRFDAEAAQANPVYQAGLARRASPELLDYVPADAVSFAMQGEVVVAPIYRAFMAELEARYEWAAPLLMGARVLGAAADFDVERDVLSWIGSEHIVITIPSRGRHAQPGTTDTVTLWRLDDPAGMKKCLARLEAVYNELIPPMLGDLQTQLTQAQSPVVPDLQLTASQGMFPSLRKLELSGLPMPLPAMHFGVIGNSFVMAPNQESLEACFAAAAFMEPGLEEHDLAVELLGRADLTSARLEPYGRGSQEMLEGITMMQAFALPALRGMVAETEYAWAADQADELLGRITGVLEAIDFLGDAVTFSERRAGGLVQYETTRLMLAAPEHDGASGNDALVAR